VSISFRGGFYAGLTLAVCIGLYLVWLWRFLFNVTPPTENFFHAIEHKDWTAAADFIGSDYHDQWADDRARLLERMREGFRWVRGPRIIASNPSVQVETLRAIWTSKIVLYSTDNDVMELLDERVNALPAPFELEWHRLSGKPWDWKLVRVSNSALKMPADAY